MKLPKNRWKDIKRAEENTPEGQKNFDELKQEYTEKYLTPAQSSSNNESHNSADIEYGIEHTN
ncbi:hypothetical protein OAL04_04945 [Nitrospinae bacterium]|nr:hypothetical protein [Nitrospinota bacterium]